MRAVASIKPYHGNEPVRVAKWLWVDKDWVDKYTGARDAEWDSSNSVDGWTNEDG